MSISRGSILPEVTPPFPAPEPRGHKRKRRACAECRQSKLRCDAPSLPCSRCRRLGLQCRMDGDVQVTTKNRRIEDLEKQVQQLRSLIRPHHEQSQLSPTPSNARGELHVNALMTELSRGSTPTPNVTRGMCSFGIEKQRINMYEQDKAPSSIGGPSPQQPGSSPEVVRPKRADASSSRSIESIHLRPKQIDSLFELYFERYHQYLPLLDPTLSADQYYEDSLLLFWTVISIGARRYQEDASLLCTLSKAVTSLIWTTISERPHTLSIVNALVLQATWPFPTSSPFNGNSYILSGVALQAAAQLGLHRPENKQDFSRTKAFLTQGEVWDREIHSLNTELLILISTAVGLGHLPMTNFDWTIDRSCEPDHVYSISGDFRHHLLIERLCHRIEKALSGNPTEPTGLPNDNERAMLLALLERELDDLKMQLQGVLIVINQIYLASAALRLFVFYLFEPIGTASRKQGVLKAYAAASGCIGKIMDADISCNLLTSAPVFIHYWLTISAFVLLKVLGSNYCQYVDFEAGKALFNSAIIGLRRSSVINNDEAGRCTEILAQLWRRFDTSNREKDEEPILRITSRSGASVLHDCVWLYREEFCGQPNAYPSPSTVSRSGTVVEQPPLDGDVFDNLGWIWDFEDTSVSATFGISPR